MEAVNTKNRINYISGMKAFMLLIIFLIHAGVRGNQISQRACDFLFVISGYLIGRVKKREFFHSSFCL